MGSSIKKSQNLDDLPRKYPLTDEQKRQIPRKFREYISVREDAITLIKKHIARIKQEDPEGIHYPLEDLYRGLENLTIGLRRVLFEGKEGLIADLERFPKGRRPRFGLSRGFGACLWQGTDWEVEIKHAVYRIEDYWANM